MLTFRRKILISDVILFIVFIAFLFPFVERTVKNIAHRSMDNRAEKLIASLKDAASLEEMIHLVESEEQFFFQRITLFDSQGLVLFDSHPMITAQEPARSQYLDDEIDEIFDQGSHYTESYFFPINEKFSFIAIPFAAHGNNYVLKAGFPFREIHDLTVDFEKGFLLLGAFILLLYSIMTWAVIHRLTRPIQQIIDAIVPYQEGREEFLPRITLDHPASSTEFNKLAYTLNSLSGRIKKQIEQLMQKSKETEGILQSLVEGIIAFDTSGKITFSNEVACRMLGVPHDLIIRESLDLLKAKELDLCKKCHELVVQVLQTSETIVQTWFRRKGNRVFLDLIAAPLSHQNGVILVLQDKTSDLKVLEMGKDFVANASHELRTPITVIRGFAETLFDQPNLSSEMRQDIAGKLVRTCGRLDKLIKGLLTLSDIENFSEEKFRKSDLLVLAENCKHLILSAHRKTEIAIKSELKQAYVLADPDLLDLAIMNLLENAVKYSSEPAKIEMHIKQLDDEVLLEVKDHGIGIPEADIPHIFDRFYTVDKARSRKSGGAGLGLSIAKTIVDKHGGGLLVVSELGKGTTFTLALPSH